MPPPRNVLFITLDQWRGDCLSALGHPVVETPTLDALAARGVLFANHWANAAPCGPSRACLYTGTYQHRNRSILNGTPLDARFTNVALLARECGYDPVLFGYTDTSVDPRTVPAGDPRLSNYEGILPGFRVLVEDPWEKGSPAWGRWLAAHGVDVPANPHDLYEPIEGFPGAEEHGSTWAPARFPVELSQTTFVREELVELAGAQRRHAVLRPRLLHPAPPAAAQPRRLPRPVPGRGGRTVRRVPDPRGGGGHPPARCDGHGDPGRGCPPRRAGAPAGPRHLLRRTTRGGRRVGPPLRVPASRAGWPTRPSSSSPAITARWAATTGCSRSSASGTRATTCPSSWWTRGRRRTGVAGTKVDAVTESVDVLPTICEFMGAEVPTPGRRLVARPLRARRAGARALARHGALRVELRRSGEPAGRDDVRHPHEPLLAGGGARAPPQVRPVRRRRQRAAAVALRPVRRPRADAQPAGARVAPR